MTAAAITAALVTVAFILRCTVLAPSTGRHGARNHRGWEGRIGELQALTEKPGKHARRIKTCKHPHPDKPALTCTMPDQHDGEEHELRLGGVVLRAWATPQFIPGGAA